MSNHANQPDWVGNLINLLLGLFLTEILGIIYLSWYAPLAAIFLNDWGVFYNTFLGFNLLPPAVKSAKLSIN